MKGRKRKGKDKRREAEGRTLMISLFRGLYASDRHWEVGSVGDTGRWRGGASQPHVGLIFSVTQPEELAFATHHETNVL